MLRPTHSVLFENTGADTSDTVNKVVRVESSDANGVGHVHTYDNRDRLTNVAVNGPAGVLATYGQTYSPNSHKMVLNESITGNANSAQNGALAYGLDPVGNRLSLTSTLAGIAAQTNTFDGNDRLVADTYDANGNTLASGGNAFAYDFEDRLTSYNAGAITYVYDGDGNRVARTAAGSTTRFLIDTLTPTGYTQVAEEVVAGFVVRQYTHGLMRVSQRQNISGTWTTSYYGYDGFGSTRQLLSAAGVVTDTFAFDGFGNLVARTGSTPNQYLYRGEALDAGTGMYYLRARWYRVGLGRFLNMDTVEERFDANTWSAQINPSFQFARGNPVTYLDPSGHAETAILYKTSQAMVTAFVDSIAVGVLGFCVATDLANDPECWKMNSGKLHAQGDVFGKGDASGEGSIASTWSQPTPPLTVQGITGLAAIWATLKPSELRALSTAFGKAVKWISERPPYGVNQGRSFFNDYDGSSVVLR